MILKRHVVAILVLKVDSEGLHDLNVQVDWLARQSVGIVTYVQGREIQVDFGANGGGTWIGNSHKLKLVPHTNNGHVICNDESSAKHLLDRSTNF
jgi:hypothetical protein